MNKYRSQWLAQWDVPLGEPAEHRSPIRAAPGSIPGVCTIVISFPGGTVSPMGEKPRRWAREVSESDKGEREEKEPAIQWWQAVVSSWV